MQLAEVALSDIEFWTEPRPRREEAFALLRAEQPRLFLAEPEIEDPQGLFPVGPGYWSLTRHADVVECSRRAADFCSGKGTTIVDMPVPFLDFFGSMINMDDPRHARMRRIVSRAFTPKVLDRMKADVEAIAAEIVADIADRGECDFVTEVAALVPLRIIVDLMGIPRSEERFIFDRTNTILGFTDTEYVADQDPMAITMALLTAGQELATLVRELAEARIAEPADDLITALVTADVEGEMLSPEELASFFILLVAAGNETTRNAIAHGVHALSEHPDQRDLLVGDLDARLPGAVEEIVRWASPVMHFRRTATADTALHGQPIAAGDRVVIWHISANRDEDVFPDPFTFDIARIADKGGAPVAFGGGGAHYCLGANLARAEMKVMLQELLARIPDMELDGEVERLRSNFINGIKRMPVRYTPTS